MLQGGITPRATLIANTGPDVALGLKKLRIDSGFDIEHLPTHLRGALHQLTLGLDVVELNACDDPSFLFEPYDLRPKIRTPTAPSWNNLRILKMYQCYFQDLSLNQDHAASLLAATGRAVAFMPSLEGLQITIGRRWDIEFLLIVEASTAVEPLLGIRTTCLLSVDNYVPSATAVDIWRDSMMLAQRAPLDVRVRRDSDGKGWRSWEDAVREHAAREMKQLELGPDEP